MRARKRAKRRANRKNKRAKKRAKKTEKRKKNLGWWLRHQVLDESRKSNDARGTSP